MVLLRTTFLGRQRKLAGGQSGKTITTQNNEQKQTNTQTNKQTNKQTTTINDPKQIIIKHTAIQSSNQTNKQTI